MFFLPLLFLRSTPPQRHVLKTPEEYARDTGAAVPQSMKYFKHSNIPDIVQAYPLPGANRRGAGGANTRDVADEKEARRVFTHFVIGLLNPNPWKRWKPKQVRGDCVQLLPELTDTTANVASSRVDAGEE